MLFVACYGFIVYRKISEYFRKDSKMKQALVGYIHNHILPKIRNKPFIKVTAVEWNSVVSYLWETKPATAQKLYAFVFELLNWAESLDYVLTKTLHIFVRLAAPFKKKQSAIGNYPYYAFCSQYLPQLAPK